MNAFLKSIWIGVVQHYWRVIKSVFICYSVLWTIVESTAFFLRSNNSPDPPLWKFAIIGVISILFGVVYSRQKRNITIKTNSFDTKIKVCFGDIFGEDGLIAISVNEFFDSIVDDKHVSSNSLHGILIRKYFGGQPEGFDSCVDKALAQEQYQDIQRNSGRTRKYQIGTTALVTANDKAFLCVALAKTDIESLKANANVSQLWDAMVGLLQKARIVSNGRDLSIPLLGGGLSGVGLLPVQIILMIIMAAYEESKKQKICDTIKIVLPENRFEDIDLSIIESNWR